MDSLVDTVVLPGDEIGTATPGTLIRLGPGLSQIDTKIMVNKAGVLRRKNDKYWIESSQKRYVAAVDDMVIGVVVEKLTEAWKVDIGTNANATLSIYSFEGGTKRNRANLPIGSLVYARVIVANKHVEPEISCMAASGKAEGFGPLLNGYMFKCSTGLARQCLSSDCIVLRELGKSIPFEIVIGLNGRLWIDSTSTLNSLLISNSITNSEFKTEDQIITMVQNLVFKSKALEI